jgi:hypothetical protein
MSEHEIKPSFSWRYLILTFITAIIVSGVGFGITKYFEAKPAKELIVYEDILSDLIDDAALTMNQIEATYYLKGDPKKKIECLFRKVVVIKNNGNEGVEDLSIIFSIKEDDAFLLDTPKIKSLPKDVIDAMSITKNESMSSNQKHVWNVALLNKDEALIFEYSAYSEKKLNNLTFSAIPRKKNWTVSHKSLFSEDKGRGLLFEFFLIGPGIFIFVALLFVLLMIPVYRREWHRNPEVREKYESLYMYYRKHFPPPILKFFKK